MIKKKKSMVSSCGGPPPALHEVCTSSIMALLFALAALSQFNQHPMVVASEPMSSLPSSAEDYGQNHDHYRRILHSNSNKIAQNIKSFIMNTALVSYLEEERKDASITGSLWEKVGNDIVGGKPNHGFGASIASSMDGRTVAIGAPRHKDAKNGPLIGCVLVYTRRGDGEWTQLGNDISGKESFDWSGYSVAINDDGNIIAIGAPYNDDNGINAGHVRVYKYNTTNETWEKRGEDIYGDADSFTSDYFGASLAISGDGNRLLIGACGKSFHEHNGSKTGQAKIFEFDSRRKDCVRSHCWNEIQEFIGEAAGDEFGRRIAINNAGNTAMIGNNKYIKIYQITDGGNSWSQMGYAINEEIFGFTYLNYVAMSGDGKRIVVSGQGHEEVGGKDATYVYAFNEDSTEPHWKRVGQRFSYSGKVDISDDGKMLIIGSSKAGHPVKVFKEIHDHLLRPRWIQVGDAISIDASSVSISSGGTIFIGSTVANNFSGLVQVFKLVATTPQPSHLSLLKDILLRMIENPFRFHHPVLMRTIENNKPQSNLRRFPQADIV